MCSPPRAPQNWHSSFSLTVGEWNLPDVYCPHKLWLLREAGALGEVCHLVPGRREPRVPCSPGLSPLTVTVLLGWVGDQPTVVRSRGHQVWNAVIVIIIVTLVTDSILISVQLGAVNDVGAVVCAVLVPVSVTVGERRGSWSHRAARVQLSGGRVWLGVLARPGLWPDTCVLR